MALYSLNLPLRYEDLKSRTFQEMPYTFSTLECSKFMLDVTVELPRQPDIRLSTSLETGNESKETGTNNGNQVMRPFSHLICTQQTFCNSFKISLKLDNFNRQGRSYK